MSSSLPDNLGDSRFWTISPGLQIRVWNLLDNRQSLPFLRQTCLSDNKISTIVWIDELFSCYLASKNVSSQMPTCHCKIIMWLVGSKPIRSNVTMQTTSFSYILSHSLFVMIRVKEHFLHTWRHVPCVMTSSIIPSLSIFHIWRRGGFWQPCHYREYINPPHQVVIDQNNYVFQWYISYFLHQHTNSRGHREYELTFRSITLILC